MTPGTLAHLLNQIHIGHCLEVLRLIPDNSVHCCITSPPYYSLRDYGLDPAFWPAVTFAPMAGLPEMTIPEQDACLGLEKDIWAYVGHLVLVFREVRRALREDGVLWLNLGDSYVGRNGRSGGSVENGEPYSGKGPNSQLAGMAKAQDVAIKKNFGELPDKNLLLIPHRVALALQADGWWLRSDCPWIKRNGMPGSQQDRPTVAKEYWFLLSKAERYYFDLESIKMPAAESTGPRLKRGVSGNHKNINGAPGQTPHSFNQPRPNTSGDPAPEPSGRARRDSDWFFDSLRAILDDNAQILLTDPDGDPLALTVNPTGYKAAHFATFPAKLIEPMILASTSAEGVCGKCGAQWVREVEKVKGEPDSYNGSSFQKGKTKEAREQLATVGEQERTAATVTTGWRPSCQCNVTTVPATVLDPFMGSGTTAKVAIVNRRNFIGIDANPTYAEELAPERLNGTQIKLV